MENETLMHSQRRGGAGLRKAKCVRSCRAKKGRGRWSRKHKRTIGACRRACGVKKK